MWVSEGKNLDEAFATKYFESPDVVTSEPVFVATLLRNVFIWPFLIIGVLGIATLAVLAATWIAVKARKGGGGNS